jgi:uncharacterized protein (DUF3084 family)
MNEEETFAVLVVSQGEVHAILSGLEELETLRDERNAALAERAEAVRERDIAKADALVTCAKWQGLRDERNAALAERDEALAAQDKALDAMGEALKALGVRVEWQQ